MDDGTQPDAAALPTERKAWLISDPTCADIVRIAKVVRTSGEDRRLYGQSWPGHRPGSGVCCHPRRRCSISDMTTEHTEAGSATSRTARTESTKRLMMRVILGSCGTKSSPNPNFILASSTSAIFESASIRRDES